MAEPLLELHCHSEGLLDPPMVRALAAEGNGLPLRAEDLSAVWPVRSQAEWTDRYQPLVAPCLMPVNRRLPLCAAHVRNLVRQNVVYAELMVSGLLAPVA